MAETVLTCVVRLEGAAGGGVVVSTRRLGIGNASGWTAPDRLKKAVERAFELDAQCRDLASCGSFPRIDVPVGGHGNPGRVHQESLKEYRRLRLDVGSLIRPLLFDPPCLEALYPFQRKGVEWLRARAGAILADDMGLGKTIQVIAAARLLFNTGHVRSAIVVCPKSLIANWERGV